MQPDIKHLKIVIASSEQGSFSAAALRLNIEVSAVSRSIREVEEALGVALFERLPRGVRPTEAGVAYIDSARDIVARLAQAERDARLAARGGLGHLSIGFVWSFTSGPSVALLRRYAAKHPGVSIRTVEDGQEQLTASLLKGELDVILAATDPPPYPRLRSIGGLHSLRLWRETLCAALPSADERTSVTWDDLASQRLLCTSQDDWRRFVEYVQTTGGPKLSFQEQNVSRDGLLGLVAAGFGRVIIPNSLGRVSIAGVRIASITSPTAALQVEALWCPRKRNPALDSFLDLARSLFDASHFKSGSVEIGQSLDPSP